ncbi:MAG: prepilin-type N-terminal cleavage/methylation domain-containing protein [Patescibacteria group bacterium]
MSRSQKTIISSRAFTLVELLVSIGIFALMTALIVVKYGNFNNSILLTNLAYDVAGTVRTAQTYGLSVRSTSAGVLPSAYGVYFNRSDSTGSACTPPNPSQYILFADNGTIPGVCDIGDTVISTFTLRNGARYELLVDESDPAPLNSLTIYFRRPDPEAAFGYQCEMNHNCVSGLNAGGNNVTVVIRAPDNSARSVMVRKNGQISVIE